MAGSASPEVLTSEVKEIEMLPRHNSDTDPFIGKVVDFGSHYDIARVETLYSADQSILFVSGEGHVHRVPRSAMLAEFATRGAAGDAPFSTEHRILHIEQQGDHATALLYRRMSPFAPAALYELRLRKEQRGWQVAGEAVLAFPRAEDATDFLPSRKPSN
jgi:hypothetical protein